MAREFSEEEKRAQDGIKGIFETVASPRFDDPKLVLQCN